MVVVIVVAVIVVIVIVVVVIMVVVILWLSFLFRFYVPSFVSLILALILVQSRLLDIGSAIATPPSSATDARLHRVAFPETEVAGW